MQEENLNSLISDFHKVVRRNLNRIGFIYIDVTRVLITDIHVINYKKGPLGAIHTNLSIYSDSLGLFVSCWHLLR